MSSQATRQRKGGAPKSGDISLSTNVSTAITKPIQVKVAKVKRNKFGTGPFDENWLNLDCCGLFCAGITYLLHIYGVYVTCMILIPPWMSRVDENGIRTVSIAGHINRLIFSAIAVLAVCSHFKAMTTNPGAVPVDAIPLDETNQQNVDNLNENKNRNNLNTSSDEQISPLIGKNQSHVSNPSRQIKKGRRLCRRCNAFKPKRAHHCSICKRCIVKMDHHCPWVNNCVGIGNHKNFLLFIGYTCLSCIYSLTLVIMRFFDCMGQHGHVRTQHITCLDRPTHILNILGLLVEAILFGLFTSCMMVDQSGVVLTKLTHIDRLKGSGEGNESSSLTGVIEVFGLNPKKDDRIDSRFRADWLSPFHKICFPTTLQDEIYGFCRPCLRNTNGTNEEADLSPMLRNGADMV